MTRNPSENNRTERNRGAFRRTLRFKPLEDRSLLSGIDFTGVPQWVPQGPAPIYQDEGTVKETQVAGAIEAIVVHPTDENILYVATVNGGIWKTTNATYSRLDGIDNDGDGKKDEQDDDEVPSWTPLTDDLPGLSQGAMGATRDLPSLSMGAIAIDPLDYDTVYAGNARASSTNKGASRGGLLRSEDAGLHWTELGETDFPGRNVRRIVPTTMTGPGGQVILVAASERETPTGTARGGIFRSEDTGTYWKLLSTIDGLSSRTATDLIVDPGDATRFYAAFSRDGVYRSLAGSDGASWQSMNTGLPLTGSTRILLAGHAGGTSATNVVYAAVLREQSGSDLVGVFRRTDDDAAWSAVGTPPNTGNHPNLHFAIIADPDDENTVIVGGQYGNYRFDAETGNWEHLVEGLVDDTATHADHRSFAYDHNNNLLDANDGGIFRLVNPNGVIGLDRKYESLNGNLQITEINWNSSVGYDSLHDIIIAGTQDNGSIEQNVTGSPEYTHSAGGDGNTVAVGIGGPSGDRYADRYLMGNTHVTKFIRKRYNTFEEQPVYVGNVMLADSDTPDDRFSGLTVGNDAKATAYSPGIQFVTNTQEPSRVLLGRKGLYESDDFGDTVRDITAGGMVSGKFKTLVYGAAGNEDLIYAGGHRYASEMKPPGEEDHAMWVRQSGDGPPVRAVAYPPVINLGRASIKATLPRAIAVDPDDWQTAYVLDEDSHIWRTTDAGASWTAELTEKLVVDASGTESVLRSLPSGSSGLWDIELVRVGGTPVLLAAGEGGVYRRINPHLGDNVSSWTEVGRGLPNALVMALHYDSDANLLIAGTIGRGIWTIPHADAYLASAGIMTINGDQAFEGQNDTIRLALNETNPILLDVFLGCGNTPSYSVEFAAVQGIVINGLGGDDYIKIDNLPPLTRLTINGGAGDDVIHIASNDVESIVLIDGNGGSDRFDVAPNKFFSIHVDGGGPASPGDTLNILAEGRPAPIFWSGPEEGAVGVEDPPDDFQLIRFSGFGPAAIQTDGPLYPLDDWDERGPNEGFSQASDLVGGAQIQAELTIHEAGDEDWYQWTASADGWLLVTTRFCNAAGNLDLQLADSFRILLDSSTSTTDDEQVSWDVKAGQTYFIRVFGVGGATNYDYTLRIHWQGGIPPDDFEPNDSCLDGYPLESGDQTLTGLTIEKTGEFSSDDDWFRWTASETGWLTVDLLFLHRLGDLNLELHILPSDVKVVSESTTNDERVSWWVTAGESYCIRVYGFVGWGHPSYDLVLDGPEIAPGVSEGNDSFDEAFDLATGDRAIRGLTIHQTGDEDWFQWNATDKGTLIVDARFIHDLGNLDLELYDSDQTLLASSSSTTDDEQVAWKVAVDQTYYIRVFGVGGAVNREYTLELDWPFDTPQDRFEPNDRFGQAFDFGEGDQRYTGLTIHEIPGGEFVSNEDWYKWTASDDGALTVNVHFLHALGDVNLELYETSQTRLAFSNSTTNDEQVSWWEVEDGRTY